ADQKKDRTRAAEGELPPQDQVEPRREQRHAQVQAPPPARSHRFRTSSSARSPGPVTLSPSQRKKPSPVFLPVFPSATSAWRIFGGWKRSEGSSAASVSAIARRTSRPTRSLVFSGPIRWPPP